jgi:hypothetical protein
MKLIGSDKMDEVIYQCDICHIDGAKNVSIIVDDQQHLCVSCWCEKQSGYLRETKQVLVLKKF